MAKDSKHSACIPHRCEQSLEINSMSPSDIECIAIDQRGKLGFLYNRCIDHVVGKLKHKFESKFEESTKPIKCRLTTECKTVCQNLLEYIGIEHHLRLSILSEITQTTGMASVINYSQSIDEYTRLFYIYHESRIESNQDLDKMKKLVKSSICERCTWATHLITKIIWGIHLLVIFQLPPDYNKEIDVLLLKVQQSFLDNKSPLHISSTEKILLSQILIMKVYSNIDNFRKMDALENIFNKISDIKKHNNEHRPLQYILTPIGCFFGEQTAKTSTLIPHEPYEIGILEYYLLQQKSELKLLDNRVNVNLCELLQGNLKKPLENIQNELSKLQALHMEDIERLQHLILDTRKRAKCSSLVDKQVSLDPPVTMQKLNRKIIKQIEQLESKGELIKLLQNDGFEYCDVEQLGIQNGLDESQVKDMLFGNDTWNAILFSADRFRSDDQKNWTEKYSEMLEKSKEKTQLRLVYADFTYSTYKLQKMTIDLRKDMRANDNPSNFSPYEISRKVKTSSLSSPLLSVHESINILLLGESGVGKSTFINAFVNYSRFKSLDEAEKGKAIVIIPVSFLMTMNDNFDEILIEFGQIDSNENHNESGQSVTQQCKSYVFNISDEKKLCIIDTPGFGDTRGNEQDDRNMEEIFSFLHNFTYLNGICLLFKPEVVQLNPYLGSCLIQLFDYFGENIRDHFIFCFTNARSTFFAPGNTRQLLKALFKSIPTINIPFEKKNTFCFDSESFRYLVAIRNFIKFNAAERNEFEQSWLRSTAESKRLYNFLCNQSAYRQNIEWQSSKHARFQINIMIRPILEAMRNLLRNILLYNFNSSIELLPTDESPSSVICYECNRTPQKFGRFWILPDHLHNSMNMFSFIYFSLNYLIGNGDFCCFFVFELIYRIFNMLKTKSMNCNDIFVSQSLGSL